MNNQLGVPNWFGVLGMAVLMITAVAFRPSKAGAVQSMVAVATASILGMMLWPSPATAPSLAATALLVTMWRTTRLHGWGLALAGLFSIVTIWINPSGFFPADVFVCIGLGLLALVGLAVTARPSA